MDMDSDFIMLEVQDGFVQVVFPSLFPYLHPLKLFVDPGSI